jgi:hypothetical protein
VTTRPTAGEPDRNASRASVDALQRTRTRDPESGRGREAREATPALAGPVTTAAGSRDWPGPLVSLQVGPVGSPDHRFPSPPSAPGDPAGPIVEAGDVAFVRPDIAL